VSSDKSYDWLLKCINMQLKERTQHISVLTDFKKNDTNDRVVTKFAFLPSLGKHYFLYKNHWLRAERTRESTIDRKTGYPVETLKLEALGRNVNIFNSLLEESREKAAKGFVGKTAIYTVDSTSKYLENALIISYNLFTTKILNGDNLDTRI
jgi:mitochondrial chaperone BCS1